MSINTLSNSLFSIFSLTLFTLLLFNHHSCSANENTTNTNTQNKLENKINNLVTNQHNVDFYIINLFKDKITIECEDSISHKNKSIEINSNNYIVLKNCNDAIIFYGSKSFKYSFDKRFNSKYYVIKKSRSAKLEIRVETPRENEGSNILNEIINKQKE